MAAALLARAADRPERGLSEATLFLDLFGTVVVAWMWLHQATLAAPRASEPFFAAKLAAARAMFRWELPRALAWADVLLAQDDLLAMDAVVL